MCAAGAPSSHSSAEGRTHAMLKQAGEGVGFRVKGSRGIVGFRVWGSRGIVGFRVYSRVSGAEFRAKFGGVVKPERAMPLRQKPTLKP